MIPNIASKERFYLSVSLSVRYDGGGGGCDGDGGCGGGGGGGGREGGNIF